jgi:hypothetical protein
MQCNERSFCLFLFVYFYLTFLFLFFLIDTSLVVFHDAYFYSIVVVVLCFSRQAFLRQSLGEYFRPTFFFPSGIVSLSLYIGDNVSFKFGGREKKFVVLLYIL